MQDIRLLITGAAGNLGRVARAHFAGKVAHLRLSDRAEMAPAGPGEETVVADLADRDAVYRITSGMDAVLHLGGRPVDGAWDEVVPPNILGAIHLWEGARLGGVKRVIFASSNHATGLYRRAETIDHTANARPDGQYGLSKAFGEDLAALYAYKYGIRGMSLRIGSCFEKPVNRRMLSTWMSFRDFCHLVEVGLTADYWNEIVYGMSRNSRAFWDNSRAYALGYNPQDDAEAFAAEVGSIVSQDPIEEAFQGGGFVSRDYVGDPSRVP